MRKKLFLSLILSFLIFINSNAQNSNLEEMMYANGKIYTVAGVLLIILLGLIFYLIRIDKKVSKIEKEIKNI